MGNEKAGPSYTEVVKELHEVSLRIKTKANSINDKFVPCGGEKKEDGKYPDDNSLFHDLVVLLDNLNSADQTLGEVLDVF